MTNSCCCGICQCVYSTWVKNGLEKYRLAKKWEQFKIVLLFMDHPVCYVFFENFGLGKLFRKEKKLTFFLAIFGIFKILKIRDSSFVALLILRHFI